MPGKKIEQAIEEFYLTTKEYCLLVENVSSVSKLAFLSNAQKIMALVYLKASILPRPKLENDSISEKFVQESDWEYIRDQVSLKLGLSDKYIELLLPEDVDPENFEAIKLSESFADIYQDLRDFSSNYEINNEEAILASLSECLDNFEKFWGIRTLSALSVIHNLIYGGEALDDEQIENKEDIDKIDTKNWIINQRFNN